MLKYLHKFTSRSLLWSLHSVKEHFLILKRTCLLPAHNPLILLMLIDSAFRSLVWALEIELQEVLFYEYTPDQATQVEHAQRDGIVLNPD